MKVEICEIDHIPNHFSFLLLLLLLLVLILLRIGTTLKQCTNSNSALSVSPSVPTFASKTIKTTLHLIKTTAALALLTVFFFFCFFFSSY